MTSRRFEFKEGSSNKFWEISLEGARVTTRYGKLGASGQTTVKDSPTPAGAQKVYDSLIKEKTGKGYAEVITVGGAKPAKPPAPVAPVEQTAKDLLRLAMELTDGGLEVARLEGRAKALAGKTNDRFVAAARLFAEVPRKTEHGSLGAVEVDGRRAAAAYFSGDHKGAKAILGGYQKLTEFQAHWLYTQLLDSSDVDEAVTHAAFALTVHPTLPRALKILAVHAIHAGRPRDAVPFLETALKENPTYASGWYNLACAWSKAREKAQMLAALTQAITHGKATTGSDYRKTALADADFKPWLADADFIALVRPMAGTPGAEAIDKLYERDAFDGALGEAARLMAEHPAHAKTYAKLARRSTKAVIGDLEEHGDANADDYGLGGVDEYEAIDAALKAVEAKGDAASVKAYTALLPKAKPAKAAKPGKSAKRR